MRRMAQRRTAGLADRDPEDGAPPLRAALPRRGHATTSQRVNEIVVPRQIDRGGPVILVQIENEYGAYGSDKAYLAELVRVTRDAGITVPLTTRSTSPSRRCSSDGSARGPAHHRLVRLARRRAPRDAARAPAHRTADVHGVLVRLVRPLGREAPHRRLLADAPPSSTRCSRPAHRSTSTCSTAARTSASPRRERLGPLPADGDLATTTTRRSTSRGDITEKFCAFREVIAKHAPVPDEPLPEPLDAPVFEVALESVGDRCDLVAADRGTFDDAADDGRARCRHRARRVRGIPRPHRRGRAPPCSSSTRCATTPGCTSTAGRSARCSAPCARTRSTMPARPRPAPARRGDRPRQLRHQDRRAQGPDR